jgi:hypothetical protein
MGRSVLLMRKGCDMVTHMKTTIDIADSLLEEAKQAAASEKTTLRALVEEGLRAVLDRRRGSADFKLEGFAYRGSVLRAGIEETDFGRMLDIIHDEGKR